MVSRLCSGEVLVKSIQGFGSMRNFIFFLFGQLREGFAVMLRFASYLENGIPAEAIVSSGRDHAAATGSRKHQNLLWRLAVGEYAARVRSIIIKTTQHAIQAVVTKFLEEPLYVRPREAPHRVEAEASIFNEDGVPH